MFNQRLQSKNHFQPVIKMTMAGDDEMALSEHIEEFSQRLIFCLICLILATLFCFADVKEIVRIFQAPAIGVKFLQFAPGEYFFASVKIAAFCGILLSSPLVLYQLLLYLIPGLTKSERDIILPVSFGSGILFLVGLGFSYFFLVPAALRFFISYGSDVVEPFWSFDQYFDFIAVLLFATGLAFQVPAIQVVLGLLGIVSGGKNVSRMEICNRCLHSSSCRNYTVNRPRNPNLIIRSIIKPIFRWLWSRNFIKERRFIKEWHRY
jgi:sec-independent protein translocase protein TatC